MEKRENGKVEFWGKEHVEQEEFWRGKKKSENFEKRITSWRTERMEKRIWGKRTWRKGKKLQSFEGKNAF